MAPRPPRVAITLGDPRGIGPEVVGKALLAIKATAPCVPVIVGPAGCGIAVDVEVGTWVPGADAAAAGMLAGGAIERATAMAMSGAVDAICTAPIDKRALLLGGYDYPGHTEMLAALTGAQTVMMLASDRLRVVLVTTHIPLRSVPDAVTAALISTTAAITRRGLQELFGISEPRLALCALNPHGGDGGRFGDYDEQLLSPSALASGIAGPFPADTVFVRAMRGEFDVVLAPYHDVGMTAIKVASFGSAVNVTLGLPFVRTSPDHGTALDIAGRGVAEEGSMVAALELATSLARRRMPVE